MRASRRDRATDSLGSIEDANGGILRGSICLAEDAELLVYADGQLLGRINSAGTNDSKVPASVSQSGRRFQFPLPPEVIDGDEHTFEIRLAGVGRRYKGTVTRVLPVALFDSPANIGGWIDGVDNGLLYGWYAAPTGSRLIVTVDGHYLGTTRNNIPRDDVVAAGHSKEPVGFEFELPEKLSDGREHRFEVRSEHVGVSNESLVRTIIVDKGAKLRTGGGRKTRAAVVCWDLGHNPAGRALVLVQILERLYDEVDLIGPLFQRFGGRVWEPIANNPGIRIEAERVSTFAQLEAFRKKLLSRKYDFVHMCKPRWPTLFLGVRLAQSSGCQFALDIDDYELSFFKGAGEHVPTPGTTERIRSDRIPPFDLEATLLSHSVIESFHFITVSNVALQHKFGGTIIRHARDETVFDPTAYNREQIRWSFGYGVADRVVLFVGTIRRHKGVVRIAEAIAQLGRSEVKLCLVGPLEDPALEAEVRALLGSNVCFHRGIPFSALAATTLIADLICLPQDLDSEVSQYQIPAKVTDALAMGIPVIVEDLPPFRDLANVPGIYIRRNEPLSVLMSRALESNAQQRQQIRSYFLTEFSTAAATEQLNRQIATAPAVDWSGLDRVARRIGIDASPARVPSNQSAAVIARKRGRDVVFLWKQNDSGLFGRRSDMIVKYLVKQGFAGRVLQFDATMSLDAVIRLEERAEQQPLSADGMVYRNVVARHLGLAHDLQVSRFTLLHDNARRSFMGQPLPSQADLPEVLRMLFRVERLSNEAVLWVCPVAFDLNEVTAARDFPYTVVDLIDDQRSFTSNDLYKRRLSEQYALAMAHADVVFANCEGVAARFANLTKNPIHIVSNGAERILSKDVQAIDIFSGRKDVLRIGYVGNLRDRIDIDLLRKISAASAAWQLILVGPTGGDKVIEELGRHTNVTLLGPQRYDDSVRIAASFDVAIIPHMVSELTAAMNPLKMYFYQMLGLPIVSTEVANMTGANSSVRTARNHRDFLKQLRDIERRPRRHQSRRSSVQENVYWDENVAEMIRIIKRSLSGMEEVGLRP